MEKIDLSLAIVTYNNSKIIEDTVRNILSNIPECYTYRMYIIDNNSTDNTLKLVRNISENIEVLELGINKGFGYGHNQILNIINSRYHLVVNPDIKIENPEQIKNMIDYMDSNLEIGMLSPVIVSPDLTIQYLCKTNPTVFDMLIRRVSPNLFSKRQDKYVLKDYGYDRVMEIDYATGSFMVFRTDIFKEIKGFDDSFFMYLEDADITRRAKLVSKVIFYPEARVIHAWERGSYKSFKLAKITIESMIIYFNKWGWKLY